MSHTLPNIQRVFLGLEKPPLLSVSDWLVARENFVDHGHQEADLSDTIVVVPESRSRVRLLQLILQRAETSGRVLIPPTITTLGQLPEHLYEARNQLATELAQQIAWSKALESTPKEEIRCLTGRPDVEELNDWQPLANLLSQLHHRLANDIWSFQSVAREVKKLPKFLDKESARWEVLREIQARYYAILKEAGLWDKQAARNFAAAGLLKGGEIRCYCEKRIVWLVRPILIVR